LLPVRTALRRRLHGYYTDLRATAGGSRPQPVVAGLAGGGRSGAGRSTTGNGVGGHDPRSSAKNRPEGRLRGPQSWTGRGRRARPSRRRADKSVCFTPIVPPQAARTSGTRLYTSGASSAPLATSTIPLESKPARRPTSPSRCRS
jgi:hypothetical protein